MGLCTLFMDLCVANSYSRGDREFEKATAMLFPSEIVQRGRMRDHTAVPFRRRVTVKRRVRSRMVEVELETSQLSLQVSRVPKKYLVKKFAPYASNQPLYEGMRNWCVGNRFNFVYL